MRFAAKLSLLPLGVSIALATACSSNIVDDPSASKNDEIVQPSGEPALICSTIDYEHDQTATEYFRIFDTDAAAGEFIEKILATGQLASMSGPGAKLKEITQDARLNKLVAEVFAGFQRVFPKELAGLTAPPRVAIVESAIVNAFAMGTGFAEDANAPRDKAPYLFVVHTALLNHGGTDTQLRGVFAHELGHLLLRTFLPKVQAKVRAIYTIGKEGEDGVFGAVQEDDAAVADHVQQILEIQKRIGGMPDLGFPVALEGQYVKLLKMLTTSAAAAPAGTEESKAACATATAKMEELKLGQKSLMPNGAAGNYIPATPTAEQQAKLDALSLAIRSNVAACFAPVDEEGSLLQLTAMINNMGPAVDPAHPDHAKLLAMMLPAETRIDAEMPGAHTLTKLLAAIDALTVELKARKADPAFPIDSIRVFDYEEDADDAAVRVLGAIGDDPTGISQFLLSVTSPETQAKCKADVAAGTKISYGRLIDPHQPICWRYYHTTQLAKALATQCAPQPLPASKNAKLTPAQSTVESMPGESEQKGYGIGQR